MGLASVFPIALVIKSVKENNKFTGLYCLALNDSVSVTLGFVCLHVLLHDDSLTSGLVIGLLCAVSALLSIATLKRKLLSSIELASVLIDEQFSEHDQQGPHPNQADDDKEKSKAVKEQLPTPIFMVDLSYKAKAIDRLLQKTEQARHRRPIQTRTPEKDRRCQSQEENPRGR